MNEELSRHLDYRSAESKPREVGDHRSCTSGKAVLSDDGPTRIELPRDRDGSYERFLIPNHERRFTGFDDKIIAVYARGITIREIQDFLAK